MDEQQNDLIPQEPEQEQPKRPDSGRLNIIRVLIGGYIAYLGAQLIKSFIKGTANSLPGLILAAGIVFVLAGGTLVVWSVWRMVQDK